MTDEQRLVPGHVYYTPRDGQIVDLGDYQKINGSIDWFAETVAETERALDGTTRIANEHRMTDDPRVEAAAVALWAHAIRRDKTEAGASWELLDDKQRAYWRDSARAVVDALAVASR